MFKEPAGPQKEGTPEGNELSELGAAMEKALEDFIASKAGSEDELREAFRDSLIISRSIDSIVLDTEGTLLIDVVQEEVDKLVKKHGLPPEKFDIFKLKSLTQKFDEAK